MEESKTEKVLVLRTCNADMTSHNGFKWPQSGPVQCDDWIANDKCGNGLHGLLWGKGDYSLLSTAADAKWLIVEVNADTMQHSTGELANKCKFPSGNVVCCGTSREALAYLRAAKWGMEQTATTGNYAHSATTGNYAHSATTGNSAHSATTGNSAHSATTGTYAHSATTGNYAHSATTGNSAHSATTGNSAHSTTTGYSAHSTTTGYSAHSTTTGDSAHSATTGYYAHSATTGNSAHSTTTGNSAHSTTTGYSAHSTTTGYSAHSTTTGDSAIACALGLKSTVQSQNGPLVASYYDGQKMRVAVAYPGENGIKPDTPYQVDNTGTFIEVTTE